MPEPRGQLQGEYPTIYPPCQDVILDATRVHQDRSGGCTQSVLSVSGSRGGGFSAVFQDMRKGNAGLFLAHLNPEGEVWGDQLPISDQRGTARELLPGVVALDGGAGAMVWMKMSGRSQAVLRFFDQDRSDWSGTIPLSSPGYRRHLENEVKAGVPERDARGRDAMEERGAPSLPCVGLAPDGHVYAAWHESGRVHVQRFANRYPVGAAGRINRDRPPAIRAPILAFDEQSRLLCAWDTEAGIDVYTRQGSVGGTRGLRTEHTPLVGGAAGKVRGVLADPVGGWWMLVEHEQDLVLRHLSMDGVADRADLAVAHSPFGAVDLESWRDGLVLLVERTGKARTGVQTDPAGERMIELSLLDDHGQPTAAAPLGFRASQKVGGALLATEGPGSGRVLVTWNDDRGTDQDVYYAFLLAGPQGPILTEGSRWNDDEFSSYQTAGAVVSSGTRAVVAWMDERGAGKQIYFRRIGVDGSLEGDEVVVGGDLSVTGSGMQQVCVGINGDGRFLLCWKQGVEGSSSSRLYVQAFDAQGVALGEPQDVDPGLDVARRHPAAIATLENNRGFVLTWIREERGPVARRVSLAGQPLGEPWHVVDRRIVSAQNPEILRLDGARLICVWDEAVAKGKRVITGRFLENDARATGKELRFERSNRGGDLDPALAPAGDGGFVMVWTARDSPARDVFARFFNPDGRPMGPPLGISTTRNEQDYADVVQLPDGGGWMVAWEDDLSDVDHAVGRRIGPDRKTLSDVVMLDPKEGVFIEVRHAPRLAVLGKGSLVIWADHASGRGVDVVARLLGPDFDGGIAGSDPPESR